MTTTEAAARIGISRQLVIRYCIDKRITAVKHGRDWWIDGAEVERFAAIPRPEGWRKGRPRK